MDIIGIYLFDQNMGGKVAICFKPFGFLLLDGTKASLGGNNQRLIFSYTSRKEQTTKI